MEITKEEQKELHEFIIALYEHMKKTWNPEEAESYWNELVWFGKGIHDKYKNETFDRIVTAYMMAQEQKFKEE